METNVSNVLDIIKQPAPNLQTPQQKETKQEISQVQADDKPKYKLIQGPNVGVIELPKITKTPITDTLEIKKQENPYTIYKTTSQNKIKLSSIHTLTTLATVACGFGALFGLFKKK